MRWISHEICQISCEIHQISCEICQISGWISWMWAFGWSPSIGLYFERPTNKSYTISHSRVFFLMFCQFDKLWYEMVREIGKWMVQLHTILNNLITIFIFPNCTSHAGDAWPTVTAYARCLYHRLVPTVITQVWF